MSNEVHPHKPSTSSKVFSTGVERIDQYREVVPAMKEAKRFLLEHKKSSITEFYDFWDSKEEEPMSGNGMRIKAMTQGDVDASISEGMEEFFCSSNSTEKIKD